VAAVAATGLTALIVKAVLRGPPQLRHISVVRQAAGEDDGVIDSRFSLYIKQDGVKTVALDDAASRQVSTITPFSLHPQYADTSESLAAYQEYQIPVRDASESDPVSVSIPYRSTSKKLQTHWVGEVKSTIDNADADPIKIDKDNKLIGSLVNHTGSDLWHIFIGFKQPRFTNVRVSSSDEQDTIIYVEKWAKDDTLKLDDLINRKNLINLDKDDGPRPMGHNSVYGYMKGVTDTSESWSRFWRGKEDDVGNDLDYALPMLTFFDRLPPYALLSHSPLTRRYEMFRREARDLDLSAAFSAGSLVIVARSLNGDSTDNSAMPAPLTVSDSPVAGYGTTIYQAVLPIDRSAVYGEPSTQPTGNN
jgi:hypothetical protein